MTSGLEDRDQALSSALSGNPAPQGRIGTAANDAGDGHATRLEADLAAMRRLYDLQAKLALETDLKAALGEIVAAAADFTGTDRGCVQLVSEDGERLEMFVHHGHEPDSGFIAHFLHEGSKPACDAARQNQQRTIIDDVATFPALLDTDDRRIALADGIQATQSTPMISRRGHLMGVLSTQFRQPHRSSEHELKLIDMLAWTAADFVDRHLTEAALKRAEEARYRRALEIDTVPVVFFDLAGGISDANDAFLGMIGYTRSELEAGEVRYEALTPPDWAWRDAQTKAELLATGKSRPFEKEYFRRDGSRIWIHCAGKMLDEDTAVEFIIDLSDRKRAEAALRESEERFQQFAAASLDVLWIRNAEDLSMEFVSPAFDVVYGLPREEVMGDVRRWAARIVPDDRDAALSALGSVRSGEAVVHEFRIQRPSDGAFRWIRNTDFPLLNESGQVQRVAGIATDVTEERLSAQHHRILLEELQHRVRNIMAMIKAVTVRTGDTAGGVQEYASLMSGRLAAMARTQTLLTHAVSDGVEIGTLIREELVAQAHTDDQYKLSGPRVLISPKAAEVLTLAVHELTTNALKYGALGSAEGSIAISWRFVQPDGQPLLRVTWSERRRPSKDWSPPTRRGFGTSLIEDRVPYELDGRGKVEITREGVEAWIEFPLRDGASILETDSPILTKVSGGSLDMSTVPALAGKRILVMEDDFYLAADVAAALRMAGAVVIGPFGREEQALDAVMANSVDGAVLDINLGAGPSFVAARAVRDSGVPYLFLTGYNPSAIPEDLQSAPTVRKPVELKQFVQELTRTLNA